MRFRWSCGLVALLFLWMAPGRAMAQTGERTIPLGEVFSFHSSILEEDRRLQVSLPETYDRTTIAYPVLFLLDGSSHLLHATATARFLAAARNRIPELIVVAIPNTNRNRDMTPGPGAATFERVLAEEIIPWVERTFRAAPERVLAGHSLSASFAVHALLNRPELFDGYVVASAPVWRYDGLAGDITQGFPRAAKANAAVYLSVGQHENEQLRDGMQRFADALRRAGAGGPAWTYADLIDADHSSTPQQSLHDALEARYRDYRFPFFENPAELEQAGGLQGLEAHYRRAAGRLGYDLPPPEARLAAVGRIYLTEARHDDVVRLAKAYARPYPAMAEQLVNQVGYDLLKRGETARAVQAFKDNAGTFPGSPNVHDSLGDAYCRAGDAAAAIASYQQAARVAEASTPPHPRLASYQKKAQGGCPPSPR